MRRPPWWKIHKPVTHLYIAQWVGSRFIRVACGMVRVQSKFATEDVSKVTCKNCKRTRQDTIDNKIEKYTIEEVMAS